MSLQEFKQILREQFFGRLLDREAALAAIPTMLPADPAVRAVRSHDHRVDVVDLPDPTAPADGVVVRIAAAGICGSDLHMVERFDLPVTLGHEFSGFLPDGRLVAVEPLGVCRTCAACLDASNTFT